MDIDNETSERAGTDCDPENNAPENNASENDPVDRAVTEDGVPSEPTAGPESETPRTSEATEAAPQADEPQASEAAEAAPQASEAAEAAPQASEAEEAAPQADEPQIGGGAPGAQPSPGGAPQEADSSGAAKPKKKRKGWKVVLIVAAIVLILALLISGPLALSLALLKLRARDPGNRSNMMGDPLEDLLPPGDRSDKPDGEKQNDIGQHGKNYNTDDWVNPGNLNDENAIVNVAAKCSPSVVTVKITTASGSGSGSGVIWSSDGYIVTNNHVVEDAETVRVVLVNGDTFPATVIETDAANDLALLRIVASGLLPVSVGDSASLKVGQTAIVIGNPLGTLANSVTSGIISALARDINVEGTVMNVMQTTAAINLGNSGGGCFDVNGKLIGIVNAKKYATGVEGLGFAIPVDTVKSVISDMIGKDDKILRKSMGIIAQEASESSYAQLRARYSRYRTVEALNGAPLYGLYIISDDMVNYVETDTVFEQFDVIRTINGETVLTFDDLNKIIDGLNVGDVMNVEVTRVVTVTSGYRQTQSLKNYTVSLKVIEMYR